MGNKIVLVVPEAPAAQAAGPVSERRIKGSGLRVGTLDNSKGNADHLLRFLIEGVRAALPVVSVATLSKPSPSVGAETQVLDRLAHEADCVFTAMAD